MPSRRGRRTPNGEVHRGWKSVRIRVGGQARVGRERQDMGREHTGPRPSRSRIELPFRRMKPNGQRGVRTASVGSILLLVTGLLVADGTISIKSDPLSQVRVDAASAIDALQRGDLFALDQRLTAHVGHPDFAYLFTSKASPRALGDALATVAGNGENAPFKVGVDAHAYEIALTRLAGTLALATHGTGNRTLPASWARNFLEATTWNVIDGPQVTTDRDLTPRAEQDLANRQNLLLLLSRGYWSTSFLKSATKAFWDFDHDKSFWEPTSIKVGNSAPGTGKYAPSPSGTYLTDGLLALTAALTANPAASAWAFTEFQPGTTTARFDGEDHAIGRFTHYLFFEHDFAGSSQDEDTSHSVGMTATLTALSAAIDATGGATDADDAQEPTGPMADAKVLRALARSLTDQGLLSKVWDVTKSVASAIWHWVQRWGHRILDIVSFAPVPFSTVAASTNAVWYSIEGDYASAGLSLAAAVPGLAYVKIAKTAKAGKAGKHASVTLKAKRDAEVAAVARSGRRKPWKDCRLAAATGIVLHYKKGWTRKQRRAADQKVQHYWKASLKGELRKADPKRSGTAASTRYKAAGRRIPSGSDIDHTLDLQLGGNDVISNMKPLDRSVNRSLGKQVELKIARFKSGQRIYTAAICRRG